MIDKAYVYIVECKDGTLYTGWTKNIEARVKVHNSGNGAKYTRSRLPVNLVFWEELDTKSEALIREAAIKKMTKKQKLILINGFDKQERRL